MVDQKLSKEAKLVLQHALRVLEHTMQTAVDKEDLEAQIAVADRLMILYQHLSEKTVRKFKPGFGLLEEPEKEKANDHESD